jgi:hypothetical protein
MGKTEYKIEAVVCQRKNIERDGILAVFDERKTEDPFFKHFTESGSFFGGRKWADKNLDKRVDKTFTYIRYIPLPEICSCLVYRIPCANMKH